MATRKFTLDCAGHWIIAKDPDSRRLYGINLAAVLAAQATAIVSAVIVDIRGVIVESPTSPVLQPPFIAAWTTGGDPNIESNEFTIRYTLADGTIDDQTLYFNIQQN